MAAAIEFLNGGSRALRWCQRKADPAGNDIQMKWRYLIFGILAVIAAFMLGKMIFVPPELPPLPQP